MKIKNLAILSGNKTTVKDGVIHYIPEFTNKEDIIRNNPTQKESRSSKPLRAEIRTELIFNQGFVQFKFKAQKKDTGVLIFSNRKKGDTEFAIGLSKMAKTFAIFSPQFETSNGTGLNQFKSNEEITIRAEFIGSECKLYVNKILYCESSYNIGPFPLSFRISSEGEVTVYDIEVDPVKPKLFVVMQFTNEFNDLYKDVIIPVAQQSGFEVVRADEFYSSTPILNDIVKSIKESSTIIADITPDNPNVFYEIGYAHAINKPTILICDKKREKLPFDISSFRTLFYENSIAGKSKIESNLKKYLDNIINGI